MEEFYDQETLEKVQNAQTGILKDVLGLCEKNLLFLEVLSE